MRLQKYLPTFFCVITRIRKVTSHGTHRNNVHPTHWLTPVRSKRSLVFRENRPGRGDSRAALLKRETE